MENGYVLGKLEIQDLISMLTPNEVQAAQEPIEDFIADTAVMRGQDSELHGLLLSIVLNLLNAF